MRPLPRLRPAKAAVELAKTDGRMDAAYDSARTATVPPDLEVELQKRPEAKGETTVEQPSQPIA